MKRRHFITGGISAMTVGLGITAYRTIPDPNDHSGHDHSGHDHSECSDGHCAHPGHIKTLEKRPRKIKTDGRQKLVIVELEGGNDLYDTLIPMKGHPFHSKYKTERGSLARHPEHLLKLPGDMGMPEELSMLHTLFQTGKALKHVYYTDGTYNRNWLFKNNPEKTAISLWQTMPAFLTPRTGNGAIPFNPSQPHPLASLGRMPGGFDSPEGKIVKDMSDMFKAAKNHQKQFLSNVENYRNEPGEALSIALQAISENVESQVFFTKQTGYAAASNYQLNRKTVLKSLDTAIRGFVEDADNLEDVTLALISTNSRKLETRNGIPQTDNSMGHVILIGKNPKDLIQPRPKEKDILQGIAGIIS